MPPDQVTEPPRANLAWQNQSGHCAERERTGHLFLTWLSSKRRVNMNSKLYLLLGSALTLFILSGCTIPILYYRMVQEKWKSAPLHGPKHVFSVHPAPPFLTEELAVAKARETLAKEGFSPSEWHLTRVHITPLQPPDRNWGSVTFNKRESHLTYKVERFRTFDVRLKGSRVICSVSFREHVFHLKEPPKLLTEELAIEKARETMIKEGYDLERWHLRKLTKAQRSKAPNGATPIHFEWLSPTVGRFHFAQGTQRRDVRVRLQGHSLVCNVVRSR